MQKVRSCRSLQRCADPLQVEVALGKILGVKPALFRPVRRPRSSGVLSRSSHPPGVAVRRLR
jgi:hypothetical protein